MLTLLSKCIDRMNLYNSAAHFGEMAGEEAGAAWKDILNLLYELLGKWAFMMNHVKYRHLLSALAAVDPRWRHAVLIFPQCLHKSSSSHCLRFLSCLFSSPSSFFWLPILWCWFPLGHIFGAQLLIKFTWHLYVIICDKGAEKSRDTTSPASSSTVCFVFHFWDHCGHIKMHWASFLMKW